MHDNEKWTLTIEWKKEGNAFHVRQDGCADLTAYPGWLTWDEALGFVARWVVSAYSPVGTGGWWTGGGK
jgi:hypothetical protein